VLVPLIQCQLLIRQNCLRYLCHVFVYLNQSKYKKMIHANLLTQNDSEMLEQNYTSLKRYSFRLCKRINRTDLHQDLLQDAILGYLSNAEKAEIKEPIAWIKSIIYREFALANSHFNVKYRRPQSVSVEISDNVPSRTPLDENVVRQLVATYLLSDCHFVERTLINLRLYGYNNVEIAELLDIPYDTIYRIVKETTDLLAQKVQKL
jgi:DNA-directed RNA polymerase specialized sigma24 family protein